MRLTALCLLALSASLPAQTPQKYPELPAGVKMDANIAYDTHKETVLDVFQPAVPAAGKRPGGSRRLLRSTNCEQRSRNCG